MVERFFTHLFKSSTHTPKTHGLLRQANPADTDWGPLTRMLTAIDRTIPAMQYFSPLHPLLLLLLLFRTPRLITISLVIDCCLLQPPPLLPSLVTLSLLNRWFDGLDLVRPVLVRATSLEISFSAVLLLLAITVVLCSRNVCLWTSTEVVWGQLRFMDARSLRLAVGDDDNGGFSTISTLAIDARGYPVAVAQVTQLWLWCWW